MSRCSTRSNTLSGLLLLLSECGGGGDGLSPTFILRRWGWVVFGLCQQMPFSTLHESVHISVSISVFVCLPDPPVGIYNI